MTSASDSKQVVTAWLERKDGAQFSWAGPFTLTRAQHAAFKSDPQSIAAHLFRRPSWPLYLPLKDVWIIAVEIVGRGRHV